MAIIGIGNDLIEIARVKKIIERSGKRFIERIFTEEEQRKAQDSYCTAAAYAKRFAAKEACAKALGFGIAQGIHWKDFSVVNNAQGRPILYLTGAAASVLQRLAGEQAQPIVHLSLTDTRLYACATVVIESVSRV